MTGFGETVVNTVAALATSSLGHFGVTLKDPPPLHRTQPVATRKVELQNRLDVGGTISVPVAETTGPKQFD